MKARLFLVLALFAIALPAGAGPNPKEQKVRKLMELTGGENLARQMMDAMMAELAKSPELPPGFAEKFKELAMKEDLVGMYVPIYLKHLQEADLDAAIGFFSSPAGQRFAKAQPAILEDSMKAGQAWGARLGQRTMEELNKGSGRSPR